MKKEVILAIVVGIIMGLFITYGVYQANQAIEPAATDVNQLENQVQPTPGSAKNAKLTIYSPEDELIQAELTTKVTGKTIANSYVIIFVNEAPYITLADETGNFSKDLTLETYANYINIHSLDEDGQDISQNRTVIVYDQPLLEDQLTNEETASPSAQVDEAGKETPETDTSNEETETTNDEN